MYFRLGGFFWKSAKAIKKNIFIYREFMDANI